MRQVLVDYMARFTDIPRKELEHIAQKVDVQSFKKEEVLLHQGDVPDRCFFVLSGCIRQFSLDEEGREVTTQVYTEEESITIYTGHLEDKSSQVSLQCVEESILVVGHLNDPDDLMDTHPALEPMIRKMMEASFADATSQFGRLITMKPEDRVRDLLKNRPELLTRLPQHQLASYLGMTPESLSRIKRRIQFL